MGPSCVCGSDRLREKVCGLALHSGTASVRRQAWAKPEMRTAPHDAVSLSGKVTMVWFQRISSAIVISFVALILIAGIIFSPIALQHLAAHRFNWAQLSNVGQSYGAASAILSALAIIGVSFTLIVQARQSKENRNYYIREMHTDLLRIGMADDRLLEAWGNIRVPKGFDRDLAVYENLIMNYFSSLYQTRTTSQEEIREHVRTIFDGAVGREYWKANRHIWLGYGKGRRKQLAKIIESEYQRSVAIGPPVRPLPALRSAQSPRRPRRVPFPWFSDICSRR